jgi:hypothetical protein
MFAFHYYGTCLVEYRNETQLLIMLVWIMITEDEINGEVFYVHAMKACRGRRGIAPLILHLGTKCR